MSQHKITIGKCGDHDVSIDLPLLMSTRLLITADSGGGKTWLLKRLIEQTFGHVGILIIDPEGEFAPLRQKYDFFLVGKGGETPAEVRSAEKVARTLLTARASAICDIYDMKASERHAFVRLFLDSLLEAPKELRRPYLVIVDEAHIFCPEKGKGESEASDAMRGLATRGRKRLLCPIYATQRLATLSKDLTGMCLNRLVGPSFESANRERGADELGIPKGKPRDDFYDHIRMLEPGNFFALGRAISRELKLVHVGPLLTTHGEQARKFELEPPPPTEKVRELLAKLGDLPKQAEEEARTVAEFKKQIRELKVQLKAQPKQAVPVPQADPKTIERAVRKAVADTKSEFQVIVHANKNMLRQNALFAKALAELAKRAAELAAIQIPEVDLSNISGGEIQGKEPFVRSNGIQANQRVAHPRHTSNVEKSVTNGDLGGPHLKILRALSELRSIGKEPAPKEMVAGWSSYSPNSGGFNNPLGNLRSYGLVTYPQPGTVQITNEGLSKVGEIPPPDQDEVQQRILNVCDGPERKILGALMNHHLDSIDKPALAEEAGYAVDSGGFNNPLGSLRSKGFIEYPRPGFVRCAEWLFLE